MKVITKGCDNPNFGKEFVCKGEGLGKGKGGCGAVLHIVPADISVHVSTEYDNSYWFVCPECSAKTYISYNAFAI